MPDEDVLLLRHERDLLAQRLERQLDELDAAHLDPPGPRWMDPCEQASEGRLACAGRPDDGHPLARLEIEVDPVEHVPAGNVGIAHVASGERVTRRDAPGREPVGRHRLDADEARERGAADLDLVEPRDEAVDGVGELLRVEDDGRHLADRRVARLDEPAAPEHAGDDREDVRDLGRREPEGAQAQRVALRRVGLREVRVDLPDAVLREPQRIDGEPAVDGLADGAGHRRVGGALAEVALRRPAEIPAGADHDRRDAGDESESGRRADPDGSRHRQDGRHGGDQRLGDREPDRAGERVDVRRRPRDEVAGPRPLDARERQREHRSHEVLAELGEDPLGDDERGPSREPREHRLEHDEHGEHDGDAIDVRARRAVGDRLDEASEQGRTDQSGGCGERMQSDDAGQGGTMPSREPAGVTAELGTVGDREQLGHSLSPRVTVSR